MRPLSKTILAVAAVAMLMAVALLASGLLNGPPSLGDRIDAVVTIAPQQAMVEAIGGDHVSVTLMVPAGQDPHTYEPTSGQIRAVSSADVYFEVGSGVEFELTRMSTLREVNRGMAIVDCSRNMTLIEQGAPDHDDDADGHQHEGNDPHIWLSPPNLKQMARNVFDGLVAVDPDHSGDYEQNLQAYEERMDSLHENISAMLADYRGMKFMVFHPAWGYFAHEYGLVQTAIEQEGQEPGPVGISKIIDQAKQQNIHVIFVSPQIDSRGAQVIADEINGEVARADPLSTDIEAELLYLAQEMAKGFSKQGT
jgi:zinc transport system substrate-binding protein